MGKRKKLKVTIVGGVISVCLVAGSVSGFVIPSVKAQSQDSTMQLLKNEEVAVEQETLETKSQAVGVNVEYHTQEEIRTYVKENGAQITDELTFAEEPEVVAPYSLGGLSEETLQSSLNMINQIRYIAGVEYNLELSETLNQEAQAAALSNYVNNDLNHYPAWPTGMSEEMFLLARKGASTSNIAWASWRGRSMNDTLVNGWMEDGDLNNLERVGHRRWIINPTMGKVGFGAVSGENGTYSAVSVFDESNATAGQYGVMWPAQNMPTSYFNTYFPWSISMGYKIDASKIVVKLVRDADGKTWSFSKQSADGYFNVNNDYCGQPGCIIFRPDLETIDSYESGDVFHVTISGLEGGEISYSVNFFDLVPIEKILLNERAITLKEQGNYKTISAEVFPENASDIDLYWTSSDTSIVEVKKRGTKEGILQPKKAGTAIVTVTDKSGNIKDISEIVVEHVPGEEADCENPQICIRCQEELVPKKGHQVVTDAAMKATCIKKGKTEGSHCSVCEKVLVKQEDVPKTEHNYEEQITKEATCKTTGIKAFTCKECKESYQEEIEKTDHIVTIDGKVEATCTEAGVTEGSHCSYCEKVLIQQKTIPATGHHYDTGVITKEATCTEEGKITYACKDCGDSYDEKIEKVAHTIVADKYVPATCMQDGKTEGSHCDVCHLVIAKQEKISALGHDYCTENMLRPATVTQSGIVTSICSRCEEVQTIEIASVGEVSLSNTSYIYDGKKKQPDVIMKDTTGNVISDKNYQILYENNTNIGQAKVIITLQGNYAGTITKNFSIVLKKGAVIAKGSYNYKITGNTSVSCIGLVNKKTTKATIPSKIVLGGRLFQVTAIADKAFKNTKLTSVIIGSNVKNIGVSAFEGCTKLTKVTVGNKVEKIGKNGFKNCNKLKTLTVQSLKLKSIGKDALKGIKNNAKVKVPAKKWIQYKKLFKGKGQGSKVKICIT